MASPSARKAGSRSASNGARTSNRANKAENHSEADKAGANGAETDLIAQMKQQHREVEALLTQPDAEHELSHIIEEIAAKWIPHTLIEEQIILPAMEQGGVDEPAIAEAAVRRDLVKLLLADLQQDPTVPEAAAKFAVLGSELEQLIEVEERPEDGVLALAGSHNIDLDALRPQIEARRTELESNTEGERVRALEPTSLRFSGSRAQRHEEEYSSMPYESNVRERDERGRFESDDDRRGGYRSRGNDRERDDNGRFMSEDDRGYRSRSSREDDYRRSGSNGGGPGRDDNGRFTSGPQSRSMRDEDDNRRGGGRGQGGWFGDSDGHSEASRRGWESREGAGYSSRSSRSDDDDRRGGSQEGRGWYGDPQGHSQAAREGWDERRGGNGYRDDERRGGWRDDDRSSRYEDDDRRGGRSEGRGWYGDPRGHAEAAREGWQERRGGGYSSRSSRDDDDDDRRGGRNSHGGWFGDAEGHSEAARRGWEERR